jgi:hypothetical protein
VTQESQKNDKNHGKKYLQLGDKVNVVVGGEDVTHPLAKGVVKALVGDKPGRVEGEGEGGLVRRVVTLEVVLQHRSKLVPELQCLF